MPDKYDLVMKEALASAPRGLVIYETIEAVNTGASWTPRFVNQRKDKMLPLVAGGDPVLFKASAFRASLPASGENGVQNIEISIQNVDRIATEFVSEVIGLTTPTKIIYRGYLSTDTSKPQESIQLTLRSAKANTQSISFLASFADILNMRFPNAYYSRSRFPSLGN